MQALSIPPQYVPTVILLCTVVALVFYNIGYYMCFFEEDPDEVAAEQAQPGFVGKHYVGKPGEQIQMVRLSIPNDLLFLCRGLMSWS